MFGYDNISPDLKEKAKQCKTNDELFALAKSEGIELTDDMLGRISGGQRWDECPNNTCSCLGREQ